MSQNPSTISYPPSEAEARVGLTLLGKWHLDALLGCGGMAAVYAGTHRNGSRGAIKILHGAHAAHAEIQTRFRLEGLIANSVPHAGVVRVLDDDVAEDGSAFLVMELLDGESLASRAAKHATLPVGEVLSLADQILDVLVAAHGQGVVHRDIKPDNIFVTREGNVKLLDFGIAHRVSIHPDDPRVTTGGQPMGTPGFMSPEQARGRALLVDARSDVWAVGATMFSLLTARPPHDEETLPEQLAAVITRQAPSLHDVRRSIPAPVVAVVDRALRLQQDDRWADARSMQLAVRSAWREIHGSEMPSAGHTSRSLSVPPSAPSRLPARRRMRLFGIAAGIVGAAVLAGASLALTSLGQSAHASVGAPAEAPRRPAPVATNEARADYVQAVVAAEAAKAVVAIGSPSLHASQPKPPAVAPHTVATAMPQSPPRIMRVITEETSPESLRAATAAIATKHVRSLYDRRL